MITRTCDQCGSNLSDETPYPGYWLSLEMNRLPNGGTVYGVYVTPPLPRGTMDFCDKQCLVEYLTQKEPTS